MILGMTGGDSVLCKKRKKNQACKLVSDYERCDGQADRQRSEIGVP